MLFLPGRMLFLFVFNAYDLSAWISLLFTAPTEVEPDEWRLRPLHLVSMLFPLPHPLPSSASRVCLLVFVEVPWHYNFKAIQRMEVISPTSWRRVCYNPMLPCFGDIDRKTTWKELSEVRCKDTRGNPLLTKTQTPHFLLKPP